jgi:hypothetical protein
MAVRCFPELEQIISSAPSTSKRIGGGVGRTRRHDLSIAGHVSRAICHGTPTCGWRQSGGLSKRSPRVSARLTRSGRRMPNRGTRLPQLSR